MSQQTMEQSEALVFNNMVVYPMNLDLNTTRNWLRNALANAPYAHPERVFRDVEATLAVFTALVPKTDTYAYDNGKVQVLLCLHGTIPITFKSIPYNIPVAFWIPTDYPMVPPIAFVVPTPSMLVRKSQHVDVSGRCFHQYLEQWNSPPHNEESNLVTLCSLLQSIFSLNPPVYTRPTSSQQSPPAPPPPPPLLQPPINGRQNPMSSPVLGAYSSQSPTPPPLPPPPPYQPSSNMSVNRPRSHSSTVPTVPPRYVMTNSGQPLLPRSSSLQHPPIPIESQFSLPSILDTPLPTIVTPSPAPLPTTQNPELVNLQLAVYEKVKQKCDEYVVKTSPELNRNMSIGEHLNQNQEHIEEERRQLAEKEAVVKEKTEFVKGRIAEIDKLIEQARNMPEVSVDDILCGTTIVYNQLFDLVAEDNAVEDATYFLGKALNSERIDLNSYMKNIRTLAREQFMRRALIQKVRRQAGLDKIDTP